MINSSGARNGIIYADSAEPKTIAELKQYGLKVPVIKGKDSINYGIQLIQEQPFKVTSRSSNLIKELQNYVWSKDKEGNLLSIPIDTWNHGLDALRYLFLMKFSKRTTHFNLKWKH
jgi:phage terminase large subunit